MNFHRMITKEYPISYHGVVVLNAYLTRGIASSNLFNSPTGRPNTSYVEDNKFNPLTHMYNF